MGVSLKVYKALDQNLNIINLSEPESQYSDADFLCESLPLLTGSEVVSL